MPVLSLLLMWISGACLSTFMFTKNDWWAFGSALFLVVSFLIITDWSE